MNELTNPTKLRSLASACQRAASKLAGGLVVHTQSSGAETALALGII